MKPKRAPQTFKVEKRESYYYILGLAFDEYPDTMLLVRLPEGDVCNPSTPERMLTVLYDEYQCNEGIIEGDRFETPHGNFVCVSYHVVPEESVK